MKAAASPGISPGAKWPPPLPTNSSTVPTRPRKAQRQKIQRMIAEQSADADDPGGGRLAQRARRIGAADPGQTADQRADRERHRRELKGWYFPGRHRHDRQQRPHQDRRQSDQGCGAGGHGCRHRERKRSNPTLRKQGLDCFVVNAPRNDEEKHHTMYCPPLIDSVEPVMAPASSAARNTTARAISSGSPSRPTGISGRMAFSKTSFGTA